MKPVLYRPGVAALLRDAAGRILLAERSDRPGWWQFPQGGRDPGETEEENLARELEEEVSLRPGDYRVVDRCGPLRYEFPPGVSKRGFGGQEHTYFLADLLAPADRINVHTAEPEFRAVRWILPAEFRLESLTPMKHAAYRAVFRAFFGVEVA